MRRNKLRFASAVLLAALGGALIVWAERAATAQQPVPVTPGGPPKEKGKGKEKEEDKDLRPIEDSDIPFSFPYERDARKKLEAARDYLDLKERPWNTVCSVLQFILDAKSDSFFNIKDKAGANVLTRRISVKTEANRIIAAFPKEGLEFYQQAYGQTAAALLADAVKENYDVATLSDLSQRYFHTKAGAEATVLLGSLYLERGNYLEAAYAFERLLARPNADDVLTPRTLFKAALALRRSGDPRHAALAVATAERLQKATLRNGLTIGRKTFSADQLRAELDRAVTAIRPTAAVGEWAGLGGNAMRNATVSGGPPFLVPAFEPRPMLLARGDDDKAANDWIAEELSRLFDRENKAIKSLPLPGFFPVTTPDMVVYRTYDGVHAVATRDHTYAGQLYQAGKERWISKTWIGLHQLQTPGNVNYVDTTIKQEVSQWWNLYKASPAASLLYENNLTGTLAHDGQTVYYVDDLAIPPPPQTQMNPNFGGMMPNQPLKQSGELADAIRAGELVAVDLASGNRLWTLGRQLSTHDELSRLKLPVAARLSEEEADRSTSAHDLCANAVFLGPPLPLNGRLYVLIELDGTVRLLCLDPKTLVPVVGRPKVPALLWTQKLGKPTQAVAADSIRRFQGAFLTAGEGILVCPTNSGAVVGVDVMSRSLIWAHAYRRIEASVGGGDGTRRLGGRAFINGQQQLAAQLPTERWRAAAPVVVGGRVLLSAYDSDKLECLDVRTGRLLWTVPREPGDLYVGGVAGDTVVVVGRTSVRGIPLTGEDPEKLQPKRGWTTHLTMATPTGHGVAGKGVFYVPVRQETAGRDGVPAAEIWAINTETGQIVSKTAARKAPDSDLVGRELPRYGLGNLVFQDGLVVSQSAWGVAVYPQLDQKKAEMDALLAKNPQDPKGLFTRGEILLDDGKLKAAVADFKAAERNGPPDDVRRGLREKLYIAYTEILRENFAAGEPYLKEYEALCEVPVDPDANPFDRARVADETLRRKRLYLYLLAKGREAQNRLGEAFDHYLALAGLGESQTLFEMPDEPSVRMRPDVWARGRIEGMVRRSADPAARRSLDERVAREWDKVSGANDLKRLREFVDVFGPYFEVGAAAELQLAEMLLGTNTDADARDAQVHLSFLRETADDPGVRARATEALARLMIRRGAPEDAVGLYLQLGKEYPAVAVRDGKTGADFLTDLLTDKRLLPHLEPARHPLPQRVKVETVAGASYVQRTVAFEVEPEGDLFPMFRRLRFVMEMNQNGSNTWTLRGLDRAGGAERCKFTGLTPPMNYGSSVAVRHVQGNGHLLLVQLGHWVYCLDLAERKEQWRKNLLGDGAVGNINQIADAGGDGDVMIHFVDGTRVTIAGRSAVLQPGYAALLTRDGLEVVEPTTRRPLWTRRNVGERTHLYGDARYVLLVELGASNRKPVSTRLLRAVDGMTVAGSADAGRVLAAAKSYQVYGRTALLSEGAEGQPQVLRLYDLATGKDVWRKQYDAKAVAVRSAEPEWTGVVLPTGEVTILAARTGEPVGQFRLDPKYAAAHLAGCTEAQLFADAERFYITLDRAGGNGGGQMAMLRRSYGGVSLPTQPVNGPMYAFDRASGKRLWHVEGLLDGQTLITERFAELPVIVAAAIVNDNVRGQAYKVVVIEKAQGAVRFNKPLSVNGPFFHSITVDTKNGTIDLLNQGNLRLHISPDERQAAK